MGHFVLGGPTLRTASVANTAHCTGVSLMYSMLICVDLEARDAAGLVIALTDLPLCRDNTPNDAAQGRAATVLVFLNEPQRGGDTVFTGGEEGSVCTPPFTSLKCFRKVCNAARAVVAQGNELQVLSNPWPIKVSDNEPGRAAEPDDSETVRPTDSETD